MASRRGEAAGHAAAAPAGLHLPITTGAANLHITNHADRTKVQVTSSAQLDNNNSKRAGFSLPLAITTSASLSAENSAQSKRCRFAVKDTSSTTQPSFHTR